MKPFFRRLAAIWLMLCMLPVCAFAEQTAETVHAQPTPYPEELQISIDYENWTAEDGRVCEVALPITCRGKVNALLRFAQQELWNETLPHAEAEDEVEMMATFRVSGQNWAGFLLTGRVIREIEVVGGNDYEETVFLTHRVLSFDMKTGEPLTLADVFPETSDAWTMIAKAADKELRAFYAGQPLKEDFISKWKENLSAQAFLPSAGKLTLKVPLWLAEETPAHNQLVNVNLYYPEYRPLMTEEAQKQTDNSHRPIVAVTYDDGPSKFDTPKIRRHLADYGASATFFIVANKMLGLADGVRSAMDYGHSIGSHTYDHVYEFQTGIGTLRENRLMCLDAHREKLGVEPLLFRAPGGHCEKYVASEIGWPIILWSYSAGDTGNNTEKQLANRIINGSKDGDILLMHDIRTKTANGSAVFLREMTKMGFMFATVEELLYLHGYTIEPNKVYHSAYHPVMGEGLQ